MTQILSMALVTFTTIVLLMVINAMLNTPLVNDAKMYIETNDEKNIKNHDL